MQGLILTHVGAENAVIEEFGSGKQVLPGVVLVTATRNDLANFAYRTQSAKRVYEFVDTFNFSKPSFIVKDLATAKTFCLRAHKTSEFDDSSNDIEADLGGVLQKAVKLDVDLEHPDLLFQAFLSEKKCYLGLDITGKDLSVRPYRVFSHAMSVKGTLAYATLMFANFTAKDALVDPFCRSGEFVIEAALKLTKTSPQLFEEEFKWQQLSTYKKVKLTKAKRKPEAVPAIGLDDLLSSVTAAKKNAKIAGIAKQVTFTKVGVDWLDTKLDEKSVTLIICQPPRPGKSVKEKQAQQAINEMFYHAKYILKPKGRIVLLTSYEKAFYEKEGKEFDYKLTKEADIWSGQQPYSMLCFEKG